MQSVIFHKQPAVARRDGVTASRRSLFVQTVLIKCKIENGKWKINVGKTVCNVKKHIMPERSFFKIES
jgi:hypothetical protein